MGIDVYDMTLTWVTNSLQTYILTVQHQVCGATFTSTTVRERLSLCG